MATSIGSSTHGGQGQLGRSEAIGKDDAWLLGLFLLGAFLMLKPCSLLLLPASLPTPPRALAQGEGCEHVQWGQDDARLARRKQIRGMMSAYVKYLV
uniref:Uncharacterized protein n=1 Tax=Oryza punctata TaxID=4537 RepID=A0A0E0KT78_ORYPU